MKKNLLLTGAILALAGTATNAEIVNFNAVINGAQAADCNGTGSSSSGTATFTLDTATLEVTYSIEYSALDGAESSSHVHSAAPCNNGSIVFSLPAGSPKNGKHTLIVGQDNDMLAGLHYVNIHSSLHGDGEIRGQILAAGPIPTVSEWGLVAMVLLTLTAGTIAIVRMRHRTI